MTGRSLITAASVLAGLALTPTGAAAEIGTASNPTVQAVAADATWLAYTPPPATPGVVCLVDSGVDQTPDTTPILVGATSLDPTAPTTDGLDVETVDGHPEGHGTGMAMLMAAPQNGWGMVGLAPTSVRVYSVRALPEGATEFPFSTYSGAVTQCAKEVGQIAGLSVISLSLGGASALSGDALEQLENTIGTAHREGLSVVAAAGNDATDNPGVINYPAAAAGVVAVGASDAVSAAGILCSFSQTAPTLSLLAPGCDALTGGIDEVWSDDGSPALGNGTSDSTALVSAVLASLRAYASDLTYEAAESCVESTTNMGNIDAAAAFDACGLSDVVQAGEAAESTAAAPTSPTANTSYPPSTAPAGPATPPVDTGGTMKAPPTLKQVSRGSRRVISITNDRSGEVPFWEVYEGKPPRWTAIVPRAGASLTTSRADHARIRVRFTRGGRTLSPWTYVTVH